MSDKLITLFAEVLEVEASTLNDDSSPENVESWEERGSKDMRKRAFERWNQLLADYEAPPIDLDKDEALKDFIARRKSEMPDTWY